MEVARVFVGRGLGEGSLGVGSKSGVIASSMTMRVVPVEVVKMRMDGQDGGLTLRRG